MHNASAGVNALRREREDLCTHLEHEGDDPALRDVALNETTHSGIYARTFETPKCEQCVRLQADNRVLLLAIYRRQQEVLELLGGDNNDNCCCFVIKFG